MGFKEFWNKVKNAWLDSWDDVGVEMGEEVPRHRRDRWRRRHAQDTQDVGGTSLMDKINEADRYEWTELELNFWIETLDDDKRRLILSSAKRLADAGEDVMSFLCKARRTYEQAIREREAEERANAPTIGSLLWAYDEARLMGAQREFFDRENKKARGY